ncbi:MAG: SLATT domain-containing protein [Gaiellaceae bacterium]
MPSKGARRLVHSDAENLAEEVLYRAECHITAARFYSNVHLFVGMATAALAAAAGGTAFAGQTVVAGIAGIAGAALAAFLTVFKPDERTQSHAQAARDHRDLVDRIDLFFRLGWTRALDDELDVGAITSESGTTRPPLVPR